MSMSMDARLKRIEQAAKPKVIAPEGTRRCGYAAHFLEKLELSAASFAHEPDFPALIDEFRANVARYPDWDTVPPFRELLAMWVRQANGLPSLIRSDIPALCGWFLEHGDKLADGQGRLPGCLGYGVRTVSGVRAIIEAGPRHELFWRMTTGLVRLQVMSDALAGTYHSAFYADSAIKSMWPRFKEQHHGALKPACEG